MNARTLSQIALIAAALATAGCGSGNADDLPSPSELKSKRPPSANPSAAGPGLDLLDRIDIGQDAVAGTWGYFRRDLLSPETRYARLQFPVLPPEEYDLNLSVVRRRGSQALHIGVVHAGKQALFSIDGGSGLDTWLSLHPTAEPESNSTLQKGKQLPWKQSVPIRISVRKSGLALSINGKNRIEWAGNPQDLAFPSALRMPDPRTCFLGAEDTVFLITECNLVPVSGEARPLR